MNFQSSKQSMNLETLVSFCKRRGFVFPSSEIYGGFAAVYDYGHYGILLKNNIQNLWWKEMVIRRPDIYGLDSGIFTAAKVWDASGHTESFSDPQMDCRDCKHRMRVDHYLEQFDIDVDKWPIDDINAKLDELRKEGKIMCEKCKSTNITPAKAFNLLVQTNLGSPTDTIHSENTVYARGETCQGIYLNFKNFLDTMRVKVPFGIAQVGKAFRNEIVARQFIFRTREFEQMEMQYFIKEADVKNSFDMWMSERKNWYHDVLQMPADKLRFKNHEKLAHYASHAVDIEYEFSCLGGFKEIEGVHARGDWDLTRHSQYSKQDLSYFDPYTNERYIPHVVETSVGLNRLVLMMLDHAYEEEDLGEGKTRIVLRLPQALAPIKVAVLPLKKNHEGIVTQAKDLFARLAQLGIMVQYDDTGAIGKLYRRQDEIGTPYCVTVDFDSLEDQSVTIRDRDSMEQERISIEKLIERMKEEFMG